MAGSYYSYVDNAPLYACIINGRPSVLQKSSQFLCLQFKKLFCCTEKLINNN